MSEALSFEQLVDSRGPALLRLAVMLTGSSHDAEDLLQTTFIRLLRHWDKVERADQPAAYARRVLVTTFLDWRRRPSRRESPLAAVPDQPVADRVRAGTDDDGWQLLRSLPRQQRAVLALRYYEDLPDARIAELLGCSEVTVRSNASRGLATLRSTLTEKEATP